MLPSRLPKLEMIFRIRCQSYLIEILRLLRLQRESFKLLQQQQLLEENGGAVAGVTAK